MIWHEQDRPWRLQHRFIVSAEPEEQLQQNSHNPYHTVNSQQTRLQSCPSANVPSNEKVAQGRFVAGAMAYMGRMAAMGLMTEICTPKFAPNWSKNTRIS